MSSILPLKECSIREIYLDSSYKRTYTIPIYQRNYAWGDDEISALVKDVYDSFEKSSEKYYIGTLVTYKRDNNVYEVIDGQQRLTTIYIILNVLGITELNNKLTYTSRKKSASTLEKLGNKLPKSIEYDNAILYGMDFADNAIKRIVNTDHLEHFKNYFLDKVHIIHYEVPKDVNLNHYFEVMNSRGEQLEKHEIVKAKLSQCFNDKQNDLPKFTKIWEACSQMSCYVQHILPYTMFSYSSKLPICVKSQNYDDITFEKSVLLEDKSISSYFSEVTELIENNKAVGSDKFQPIIDFPNFLLIILKITCKLENISAEIILDDKELLNAFRDVLESQKNNKDFFVKKFTYNLLKAKLFLDNYIIHHTVYDIERQGDNPWKLQVYNGDNPKKLVEEKNIQDEIVHLLSMFEVAFTAKQRKNYLLYCLYYLFSLKDFKGDAYCDFLRNMADKFFHDVYLSKDKLNNQHQPKPNAFDEAFFSEEPIKKKKASIFNEIYPEGGANIPLFVFNYTDYKIWKIYVDRLRGKSYTKENKERREFFEKLGCSDFDLDFFDNFYFSRTRKSLEHYYPRAKAGKENETPETTRPLQRPTISQINCFGNFAMIGSEANSSGSSWNPKNKIDHYSDNRINAISVASIKFRIMMQICRDNANKGKENGMEWLYDDMKNHQKKMLDIICSN